MIHLSKLWKEAQHKERVFIKHHAKDKTILKSHFVKAQRNFEKELRKAKGKYALKDAQSISISINHNISCFWSSINSLKPKRTYDIPIAVYINDQLTT